MSEPGPRCGTLEAWVGTFPRGTMPTLPIRKKDRGSGKAGGICGNKTKGASILRGRDHLGVKEPQKPTFHNIPGLFMCPPELPPSNDLESIIMTNPPEKSHYTRLAKPPESGEGK